jgi:hypothetical protein
MIATTRYLIIFVFFLGLQPLFAQGQSVYDTINVPVGYKPPLNRQLVYEDIDKEQNSILASDGKADKQFTPTDKEEINSLLTRALTKKVDQLQYAIETDKGFEHRHKVNYLIGLKDMLLYYRQNWKAKGDKKVNPTRLPEIIDAYIQSMEEDRNGRTIEPIIKKLPYDAANAIVSTRIFQDNPGYKKSKEEIILKYCLLHPDITMQILKENPDVSFADSLVRTIAKKYPRQLYDYAAANNKFGSLIRKIKDDVFIRTIAQMATSKSGQQYFPFLDNIVNGKITFAEIDDVKNDSVQYYKLLVSTQMEYVKRAMNKDTAFEYKGMLERVEKKATDFVNIINGLHNERNHDIRFKCIQGLTAQELYYLAVSTDGLIYTSSFVRGVYPLMMKKINNRGDSLLMLLHFDKYRKLIKMSAGFNTLDHFLASFPKSTTPGEEDPANTLMRAFVNNLERSEGLEDGVDVADSYASISETLKPVAAEMLKNIQDNYRRNLSQDNKKGIAIYDILNKLFLSADTAKKIDLTKELGIPPVYEVPYTALTGDSGRVIVQLFIYGDKDGMGVFPGLINMFSNANWKIDGSNKQWVVVNSAKGKPVSLYMNRPLPEETGEDAKAQEALCQYLDKNHIIPTVTINRGHSYNAPYTIEQMSTASKIVFMGSCGGYRMIHDILGRSPEAHIIGTKQIADVPVNNPFLRLITEKLRTGSDIQWIPFWKELEKMVTDKTIFEDYVPPHKNLGALFIKAYRRAMGEENKI